MRMNSTHPYRRLALVRRYRCYLRRLLSYFRPNCRNRYSISSDVRACYLPNRGVIVAPGCRLHRPSTNGCVSGAINVIAERKAADSRVENGDPFPLE